MAPKPDNPNKGKGHSNAITLADGLAIAAGSATQLGQPITFDYTVASPNPGNSAIVRISYKAYQNGGLVAVDALNASEGSGSVTFEKLGGAASAWTEAGGPADVVAELYYQESNPDKFDILASLSFTASA